MQKSIGPTRGERVRELLASVSEMRNVRAKLQPQDVLAIRERAARGEAWASIAQDFPVSEAAIHDVIRGRTWGHLTHHPVIHARAEGPPDYPALIRSVRQRLGLTQAQFAKSLEVSRAALRRWEQGEQSPPRAVAERLKRIWRFPRR